MKPNNKIIILVVVFAVGTIAPFISAFTVIEMFFLLIPFGVIFTVTLIYLIISLTNKKYNYSKAIFLFSIVPTFVLSQLLSGFTVDKVQRSRSENLITDIEKIKNEKGDFPTEFRSSMGIKYKKLENGFLMEYSRGFMVTEKYDSRQKEWESYGWND